MFFLQGYPATSTTNVFHCRQFVLANMFGIYFRRPAETAFGFITAGVAQMPGRIRYRTTIFTGIGHGIPPFVSAVWIIVLPFPLFTNMGMIGKKVKKTL